MSVPALLEAVRTKEVIVCVGSGGVGKTTVAASLALKAAAEGRRVVVCTIDPAKRLANALGLSALGNIESRIDAGRLKEAGIPAGGELHAMMLDLKRSWDDFITRHVPAEKREAIFQNRWYQSLSSALAGSQEYIAMEKLYELHSRKTFDLVVLDTPPTANALDFLDAPSRVLEFMDNEAARVLLGPALVAGKLSLRLFQIGGSYIAKTISRFTGAETLQELAGFMLSIQGMYGVFKERASEVKSLLGSDRSTFVLVTSAHALTIDEAIYFHTLLVQEHIPTVAVVANRVHQDPLGDLPTPSAAALADALLREGISDGGRPPLSDRLARTALEARSLAELDQRHLGRLVASTSPTPQVRVPRLEDDVYDLPGLWKIAGHLVA